MIEAICAKAKELLMRESNVVHISAPVTVVGDIHGQFYDMIEIFRIGGYIPDTNYLFLGKHFQTPRLACNKLAARVVLPTAENINSQPLLAFLSTISIGLLGK